MCRTEAGSCFTRVTRQPTRKAAYFPVAGSVQNMILYQAPAHSINCIRGLKRRGRLARLSFSLRATGYCAVADPLPENLTRSFKTISGDYYLLEGKTLSKLRRDFPNKDVDGVLHEMRVKLEAGQYKYNKRGMLNAIRNWLDRAPEKKSAKVITTPAHLSRHPALVAQREADWRKASEPPGVHKTEEEVRRICAGLRQELKPYQPKQQQERKRFKPFECSHPNAGPDHYTKWWWCPDCGIWREQFMASAGLLGDYAFRRISEAQYLTACAAHENRF